MKTYKQFITETVGLPEARMNDAAFSKKVKANPSKAIPALFKAAYGTMDYYVKQLETDSTSKWIQSTKKKLQGIEASIKGVNLNESNIEEATERDMERKAAYGKKLPSDKWDQEQSDVAINISRAIGLIAKGMQQLWNDDLEDAQEAIEDLVDDFDDDMEKYMPVFKKQGAKTNTPPQTVMIAKI